MRKVGLCPDDYVIRLLLVIAACVVGAGVASATIQRSASNADFGEYSGVTALRVDMLAQDAALQAVIHERSSGAVERFTDARHAFALTLAKARARDEEADEKASLARQAAARGRLGAACRARRSRASSKGPAAWPPTTATLPGRASCTAFLNENGKLLADLAEEREARQQHALELPIGLIAVLTLLSAALLWVGVERPARAEAPPARRAGRARRRAAGRPLRARGLRRPGAPPRRARPRAHRSRSSTATTPPTGSSR